ncbi:RDD family protein [Planococcus sp. 1R117A]|uniref:RDD family protein n=1 Tax=Planococcus sp. 1R117A TaxID=3447020 RepID=UPI003EDBED10
MTNHMNNETHAVENVQNNRPVEPNYKEVMFYERKPAGFWVRFWAYLIDILLIASVTSVLIKPIFLLIGLETSSSTWYAPYAIISAVVFYAYFVLMTKFFEQTVGKMILGLRVVSLKEEKLSWGTLLFREWIGRFISATIWPLYWIVGFTKLKQGIHDFVADTTVIHEDTYRKQILFEKKRSEGSELQEAETF